MTPWTPRWGLGLIATGALVGSATLPRTRKPELAPCSWRRHANLVDMWLTLRRAIVGTAISEVWLSLDAAGRGVRRRSCRRSRSSGFFVLPSFVAELPPPPPKPPAEETQQRRLRRKKTGQGRRG